jgi:predicted TIM-barrel fold metal-dependent hydrolase
MSTPRIIDCHNHIGAELLFYLHGDHPYAQDIPAMVENTGAQRITDWVVFPFITNVSFEFAGFQDGEVRFNPGRAVPYAYENHRLLREVYDYFPEHSDRIIPLVMLDPSRRVAEQVAALRELRESYSFAGFKIQPTILQSPIRALLNEGRAFLELAEEWNCPILIHSSIAAHDIWSRCSDILDIAEQTPGVRFCLAHSCRYDRPSLDRMAALPNAWFDCSAHRIHCESVLRGLDNVAVKARRFATDYANPTQVLHDLNAAYPGRLMWGSDSPFYSWITSKGRLPFSLKSSYRQETDCLFGLEAPVISKIAGDNILNFLGRDA